MAPENDKPDRKGNSRDRCRFGQGRKPARNRHGEHPSCVRMDGKPTARRGQLLATVRPLKRRPLVCGWEVLDTHSKAAHPAVEAGRTVYSSGGHPWQGSPANDRFRAGAKSALTGARPLDPTDLRAVRCRRDLPNSSIPPPIVLALRDDDAHKRRFRPCFGEIDWP